VCRGGTGRPLLASAQRRGRGDRLPHLTGLAAGYRLHAPAHPGFLARASIQQIATSGLRLHYLHAYLDVMGWKSVDVVDSRSAAGSRPSWPALSSGSRSSTGAFGVGIWIKQKPIADIFAIDSRHPELSSCSSTT
jgi:hypothetical protein